MIQLDIFLGGVMKILVSIIFISSLISSLAFADDSFIINCSVPSENTLKTTVILKMYTVDNSDYLIVTLNEPTTSVFITQADKDEIKKAFETKTIQYLILSESSKNANGVVTKAGYISITKEDDTIAGFLSARGNVYPLVCI